MVENVLYVVFECAEQIHKIVGCFFDIEKAMDKYRESPGTRYIVTEA